MPYQVDSRSGAVGPAPRDLPAEIFTDLDRLDDEQIVAELKGGVLEEWRPIPGWAYEVSDQGRLRRSAPGSRTYAGRILKPIPGKKGYTTVRLTKDGRQHTFNLHVLIAQAFLGPPPAGHEVNHIDSNRANAVLSNLEYVTRPGNMMHAASKGRLVRRRGEEHVRAKLTESAVLEIRANTSLGYRRLARCHGVTRTTIRAIKTERSWKHLLREEDGNAVCS